MLKGLEGGLMDLCDIYNHKNLVKDPKRVENPSCIDLIFVRFRVNKAFC